MVMIEAMACGTPVLAFRQGSVSEIIDQGVTGAIVDTMDEAVRMLPRVIELDRHAVRRRFEQRFSSVLMAKDYVALCPFAPQRPRHVSPLGQLVAAYAVSPRSKRGLQ